MRGPFAQRRGDDRLHFSVYRKNSIACLPPEVLRVASDIPVLKYMGSDRYADSFQKSDKLRGLIVASGGSLGSIPSVHTAPQCLIGFSSTKALSR